MELSPLMFFFKKITCWIYQYNGIYIFLSFLSFSFGFWLLRAYTIHRTCPSYALEKRTLTSNGYLVHIWEGVHKFRGNVNVEIVHTCIRTFIHPNIHDPKRNKNVFIPSVANKNSTYEKRFLTGFFFLSFNKKKKKIAASEWQNFLLFPSCKQDALSLAVVTFFFHSVFFFSATFCTKKCAVIVR